MNQVLGILFNLGMLASISILAGLVDNASKYQKFKDAYLGLIFGTASILGMLNPLVLAPGLIFDGRSVMLSICGYFFGPVATVVAAIMAIALRAYQGGPGAIMGVSVILTASMVGIGFYYLQKRKKLKYKAGSLFIMGVIVHILMVACMLFLPEEHRMNTFNKLAVPVLIAYPIATFFIGEILWGFKKYSQIRKRQANILEGTNAGTWEWNVATGETEFDKRWAELIGYKLEELKPLSVKTWENNTHPDDLVLAIQHLEKHFAGETPFYEFSFRMKHKKGHWLWILGRGKVISWTNEGKPHLMFGTNQDITALKQAEDYRREKLMLEKKMAVAEEALKFKQNFLANMSHEIRTPLTGILGMTEILSNTKLEDNQIEYLSIIKQSGENLNGIINNVLDFSKIEAGKIQLKRDTIKFNDIVKSANDYFKSVCKKPIEFISNISQEIPEYIIADNNRIRQIVNNIISNAVKFTDNGRISFNAEVLQHIEDSNHLNIKISIADTGKGISVGKQKMLFIPFSQIYDSDTRQFEGTGLGLSICKELAQLHGGNIGVHSELKKGSTFWFTFKTEKASEEFLQTNSDVGKLPNEKKRIKILLAEDKYVNQKVISLLLNSLGHHVTVAENGLKAVLEFEPGKFDMILMDIKMPVMDGIAATNFLRKKYPELPPIVGLSANAFEGDREKYMGQGLDEYLTKPFNENEFVKVVQKLFN